jgi:hypothetical protein
MAEDLWIDKVSLKKRWGIDEAKLIELVSQKVITPYYKRDDGKYFRMPYGEEQSFNVKIWHEWLQREATGVQRKWIDYTKEQIAEGLKVYVWFRQIDIEDVEYEGIMKISEKPQEEMRITSLSKAGQIGGAAPKTNLAIIEALLFYLEENPQKLKESNERIGRAFTKKYSGESKSCNVKVDGNPWEVYFERDYIQARPGERYDGKQAKQEGKAIKLSTFRKYVSDVKKRFINKI